MRRRAVRALLILPIWAALLLLTARYPVRESWWLVGTSGLSGVVARLTRSDGGLLKEQIDTRLLLLEPDLQPLEWHAWHVPLREGAPIEGLASPVSHLRPVDLQADGPRWELKLEGDGFQARLQLRSAPGCPGTAGALDGYVRDYQDVRPLHGTGAILRTSIRGRHRSRALYLFSDRRALVLDPAADCPAWGSGPEGAWSGGAVPVPEGDSFTLSVAGQEIRVRAGRPPLLREDGHLLLPERWIAALAGYPIPWQTVQRVTAWIDGEAAPGLLLTRSYGPLPDIPLAGPAAPAVQ